jgi:hypothetical protein
MDGTVTCPSCKSKDGPDNKRDNTSLEKDHQYHHPDVPPTGKSLQPHTNNFLDSRILLDFLKLVFADTTNRAYPIIRQFFKRYSRFYSAIRISHLRIIDPAADKAYILIHCLSIPLPFIF